MVSPKIHVHILIPKANECYSGGKLVSVDIINNLEMKSFWFIQVALNQMTVAYKTQRETKESK